MTLVRWNPFYEANTLQNRVNRLFNDAFQNSDESNASNATLWSPTADVSETEGAMTVRLEIPGVDRNAIQIHLENNLLTVRGDRQFDKDSKGENYHRIERSYGSFARSFALSQVVDQEKIVADYKDGVLKITLPKKEQAKAKKIEITTAA